MNSQAMKTALLSEQALRSPSRSKCNSRGNMSLETEPTEASSRSGDEQAESQMCMLDDYSLENNFDEHERDSHPAASVSSSLDKLDEALPEGMPSEIFVIDEDVTTNCEDIDVHHRLRIAESLAESYRAKMQSCENLTDTLHLYLRKTQQCAEDILADRNALLNTIQEMEQENNTRKDQNSLLKVIMCFSLFFYMCGGSEMFLVFAVGLYLLSEFITAVV
jgi:hypothetical protein